MSEAIAATYGGGNTFIMDEKIPLFAGQRVMITVTDAFAENMHDNAETDVERRNAAFARLEAWRKKNKDSWGDGFDWRREVEEAIGEKYGLID